MPRDPRKKRVRSNSQKRNTKKLQAAAQQARNPLGDNTHHHVNAIPPPIPSSSSKELEANLSDTRDRMYASNRDAKRAREQAKSNKEKLKKEKKDKKNAYIESERLKKELKRFREDAEAEKARLKVEVNRLGALVKEINHRRAVIWKRAGRYLKTKAKLRKKVQEIRESRCTVFKMKKKGRYTRAARALARLLVVSGTAEEKVGRTIQQVGRVLGVEVPEEMSARTVKRTVLEKGVAADMQLAYEISVSKHISFSSDSTSHKHIEYECRTIALQVMDYNDPTAGPQWKSRTMGVDTSVNHSSQVQVEGLQRRLREIADIFNTSELAKRKGLHFNPDDFAYRLVGTSGDHAADQKKSHGLLEEWRFNVVLRRLGEEAISCMGVGCAIGMLKVLKDKQIEDLGGIHVWNALSEDERDEANISIIREIGQKVFDQFDESERTRLRIFIRTGCCMHKDLNCCKGACKKLAEWWEKEGLTPPVMLPNKDNASVLESRTNGQTTTAAERRAEAVSKRGATHATMLGGLLFRHKDKKKGQQESFNNYMLQRTSEIVVYPDVSNTRYGSHGEGSATILVYHEHFISFMDHICMAKDKPGSVNIEKNFSKAIQDPPTLTEFCALALYNIAVSRPFMARVRSTENMLDLEDFFRKKSSFLRSVIENPKLWTGEATSGETGSLDGKEWDVWSKRVLSAVKRVVDDYELTKLDGAVSAFVAGALETFDERFSDEFKDDSDIKQLTKDQRAQIFFSSTNDLNESGLANWRQGQVRRPNETLHKFNATFMGTQNNTELFMEKILTEEADDVDLMRKARKLDASRQERKRREAQVVADMAKADENRKKEEVRREKKKRASDAIAETKAHLVLDDDAIGRLKKDELNAQLDCHRDMEKKVSKIVDAGTSPESETVPLKSHMKTNEVRVAELRKAVARYKARGEPMAVDAEDDGEDEVISVDGGSDDDESLHSDFYDDKV